MCYLHPIAQRLWDVFWAGECPGGQGVSQHHLLLRIRHSATLSALPQLHCKASRGKPRAEHILQLSGGHCFPRLLQCLKELHPPQCTIPIESRLAPLSTLYRHQWKMVRMIISIQCAVPQSQSSKNFVCICINLLLQIIHEERRSEYWVCGIWKHCK